MVLRCLLMLSVFVVGSHAIGFRNSPGTTFVRTGPNKFQMGSEDGQVNNPSDGQVSAATPSLKDFSDDPANPAMRPIEDIPALPRVLLIGDSISIGYTVPVRELLKGAANVHRIPENGGPTTRGLERLDAWLGTNHWDVIHFNWGLHDLKVESNGLHQVDRCNMSEISSDCWIAFNSLARPSYGQ